MATKQVGVRVAGQEAIHETAVTEQTTAGEVLSAVGLPDGYMLFPGSGQPPFGGDEVIFDRVQDGGKVFASTPAIVGSEV